MTNPLVSVILPVYNAQNYLAESIESILNQTFRDFEFIIINDGSTDSSEKVIHSFSDPRIRYFSQTNKGLGATLNIALNLATGKYMARQDQDDVSLPLRLEKQVTFLEIHQKIVLLGTRARIFEDTASATRFHQHATHSADLKFDLLFDNPFVHSSVMFRKSIIEKIGMYTQERSAYEDYDLWSRMAAVGDVANLAEVLVNYRHHEKGLSKNLSNFKEHALYSQGILNLEMCLGLKGAAFNDLLALFHSKCELYQGSSERDLRAALESIANKFTQLQPSDAAKVRLRKEQYFKIVRYRFNVWRREKHRLNPFKVFLLKLESKWLGLQSEVKNTLLTVFQVITAITLLLNEDLSLR